MNTSYLNMMRELVNKGDKIEEFNAELKKLELIKKSHQKCCNISIDIKVCSEETVHIDINHNTLDTETEKMLDAMKELIENEIRALECEVYTLQIRLENEK